MFMAAKNWNSVKRPIAMLLTLALAISAFPAQIVFGESGLGASGSIGESGPDTSSGLSVQLVDETAEGSFALEGVGVELQKNTLQGYAFRQEGTTDADGYLEMELPELSEENENEQYRLVLEIDPAAYLVSGDEWNASGGSYIWSFRYGDIAGNGNVLAAIRDLESLEAAEPFEAAFNVHTADGEPVAGMQVSLSAKGGAYDARQDTGADGLAAFTVQPVAADEVYVARVSGLETEYTLADQAFASGVEYTREQLEAGTIAIAVEKIPGDPYVLTVEIQEQVQVRTFARMVGNTADWFFHGESNLDNLKVQVVRKADGVVVGTGNTTTGENAFVGTATIVFDANEFDKTDAEDLAADYILHITGMHGAYEIFSGDEVWTSADAGYQKEFTGQALVDLGGSLTGLGIRQNSAARRIKIVPTFKINDTNQKDFRVKLLGLDENGGPVEGAVFEGTSIATGKVSTMPDLSDLEQYEFHITPPASNPSLKPTASTLAILGGLGDTQGNRVYSEFVRTEENADGTTTYVFRFDFSGYIGSVTDNMSVTYVQTEGTLDVVKEFHSKSTEPVYFGWATADAPTDVTWSDPVTPSETQTVTFEGLPLLKFSLDPVTGLPIFESTKNTFILYEYVARDAAPAGWEPIGEYFIPQYLGGTNPPPKGLDYLLYKYPDNILYQGNAASNRIEVSNETVDLKFELGNDQDIAGNVTYRIFKAKFADWTIKKTAGVSDRQGGYNFASNQVNLANRGDDFSVKYRVDLNRTVGMQVTKKLIFEGLTASFSFDPRAMVGDNRIDGALTIYKNPSNTSSADTIAATGTYVDSRKLDYNLLRDGQKINDREASILENFSMEDANYQDGEVFYLVMSGYAYFSTDGRPTESDKVELEKNIHLEMRPDDVEEVDLGEAEADMNISELWDRVAQAAGQNPLVSIRAIREVLVNNNPLDIITANPIIGFDTAEYAVSNLGGEIIVEFIVDYTDLSDESAEAKPCDAAYTLRNTAYAVKEDTGKPPMESSADVTVNIPIYAEFSAEKKNKDNGQETAGVAMELLVGGVVKAKWNSTSKQFEDSVTGKVYRLDRPDGTQKITLRVTAIPDAKYPPFVELELADGSMVKMPKNSDGWEYTFPADYFKKDGKFCGRFTITVYDLEDTGLTVTKTGAGASASQFFLYDSTKKVHGPAAAPINLNNLAYGTYTLYEVTSRLYTPGADWTYVASGYPAEIATYVGSQPAGGNKSVYSKEIDLRTAGSVDLPVENKYLDEITLIKSAPSGVYGGGSEKFEFTVKQQNTTLYFTKTGTGDSTVYTYAGTTGGSGLVSVLEITLRDSAAKTGRVTIKGLPAGAYTVTEATPNVKNGVQVYVTTPGYTQDVAIASAAGSATNQDITFTNTLKTNDATIEIDKKLGENNTDDGDLFGFQVTSGIALNSGNMTFEWADGRGGTPAAGTDYSIGNGGTFRMKANMKATISGLAQGILYTVTETDSGSYTADYIIRTVITGTNNNKAVFVNTRKTGFGKITVNKTATYWPTGGFAFELFRMPGMAAMGTKSATSGSPAVWNNLTLDIGATYRIYETDAKGLTPVFGSLTGATKTGGGFDTDRGQHYVEFKVTDDAVDIGINVENTTTTLTVNKRIDGTGSAAQAFTFKVYSLNGQEKVYHQFGSDGFYIGQGEWSKTIQQGTPVKLYGLPKGTAFYVEEAVTSGYTPSYGKTSNGTYYADSSDSNVAITFTGDAETQERWIKNTNGARLTIRKTVTDHESPAGLGFTVELYKVGNPNPLRVAQDGANAYKIVANGGDASFQITHGLPVTINGVEIGASYYVKEIGDTSKYTVTYNDGEADADKATVKIDNGNSNGVLNVNNAAKPATLQVGKKLLPTNDGGMFKIEVEGVFSGSNGASITKTIDLTADEIAAGTKKPVPGVLAGRTYTVREVGLDGTVLANYETDVTASGGAWTANTSNRSGTMTLDADDAAEVLFSNMRLTDGKLKVIKAVEGTWDAADKFEFQLQDASGKPYAVDGKTELDGTFTLSSNEPSIEFTGLPNGASFKVVETTDLTDGKYIFVSYQVGGVTGTTQSEAATVKTDEELIVTNRRDNQGALTLTKTVTGAYGDDDAFVFELYKDTGAGNSYTKIPFTAAMVGALPEGISINADGNLVITGKAIKAGNGSVTLSGLEYSQNYRVLEQANPKFTATITKGSSVTSGEKLYAQAKTNTTGNAIEYKNARVADSKLVIKKTNGTGVSYDGVRFALYEQDDASWNPVSEKNASASPMEWENLAPGQTYRVYEFSGSASIVPTGSSEWVPYDSKTDHPAGAAGATYFAEFTLDSDKTETKEYTLQNEITTLIVKKTVTGGVAAGTEFTFKVIDKGNSNAELKFKDGKYNMTDGTAEQTLKVDANGNATVTLTGLPMGNYEVVEVEKKGYTDSYAGNPITLSTSKLSHTVTITNTNGAQLAVTKHLVNSAETGKTFTFTLYDARGGIVKVSGASPTLTVDADGRETFTITGEGTATIKNILPGTYYVKETTASGYVTYYSLTASYEDKETDGAEVTAEIVNGSTAAEIHVYNVTDEDAAFLKVKKTATGAGSDKFDIVVTGKFSDSNDPTADSTKTFTFGATASDSLKVYSFGEEVTVPGVILGEQYTVTETRNANYTDTYTLDANPVGGTSIAVTAESGETHVAAVDNKRKNDGEIIVKKTVTGGAWDTADTFDFLLYEVENGVKTLATYSSEAPDGKFTLGKGSASTVTLTGLKNGMTYVIVEQTTGTGKYVIASGDQSVVDGEINVVNTRSQNGYLKIEKTIDGQNEANDTFTFNLYKYNPDTGGSELVTAPTVDGVKLADENIVITFDTAGSNQKKTVTISELEFGQQYRVIEIVSGTKYTLTAGSSVLNAAASVTSGTETGAPTARFTNKRAADGTVKLTKSFTGTYPPTGFTFELYRQDGADTWTSVGTKTFKADGTEEWTSLTLDKTYRLYERSYDGIVLADWTRADGDSKGAFYKEFTLESAANGTKNFEVTADNMETSIKLSKTVDGRYDTSVGAFEVEITGTNGKVGFTYNSLTKTYTYAVAKGSTTISIIPGTPVTIKGLPLGDYTFAETETRGYAPTYTVNGQADSAFTVSTANAASLALAVKNSSLDNAKLTVRKTLASSGETGKEFSFKLYETTSETSITSGTLLNVIKGGGTAPYPGTIGGSSESFTLKGGESITIRGLIPGRYYYVVEEATGYVTTFNPDGVPVQASEAAAIEVTNTSDGDYAYLTVRKNVDPAQIGSDRFAIVIEGTFSDGTTSKTVTFGTAAEKAAGTVDAAFNTDYRVPGALPGYTYNITETATSGSLTSYTSTYQVNAEEVKDIYGDSGDQVVVEVETSSEADGEQTVVYTNTRATGGITVSKVIDGEAAAEDKTFNFLLERSDNNGTTWEPVDGATASDITTSAQGTFSLTVPADGNIVSVQFNNLLMGYQYRVTETSMPEGYQLKGYASEANPDPTQNLLTLELGETFTATNYRQGSYKLTKSVAGGLWLGNSFTFGLYKGDTPVGAPQVLTETNNVATWNNLEIGETYEIRETAKGTYVPDGWTLSDDGTYYYTTFKVEPAERNLEVDLTNLYTKLSVTKTVSGNGNPGDIFEIEVRGTNGAMAFNEDANGNYIYSATDKDTAIKIKHGETKIFYGLPLGSYTVVETKTNGYAPSIGAEGKTVVFDKNNVSRTVAIENANQAQIQVTKELLRSNETEKDFELELYEGNTQIFVTKKSEGVYAVDPNANPGDAILIRGGKTITITDVTPGKEYSVKETADSSKGYKVTYSPTAPVEITDGATKAEITVTNEPGEDTGLRIRKTTTGFTGDDKFTITVTKQGDQTPAHTFVFTREEIRGNGEYAINDTTSFAEISGQQIEIGATYIIEEIDAAGVVLANYTTTISGRDGKVTDLTTGADKKPEVIVHNTRIVRDIELTKNLSSDVDLYGDYKFAMYEANENGVWVMIADSESTVKANETAKWDGVTAGKTYRIYETVSGVYNAYGPGWTYDDTLGMFYLEVVVGPESTETIDLGVVNNLTELTVEKWVDYGATGETFTFEVQNAANSDQTFHFVPGADANTYVYDSTDAGRNVIEIKDGSAEAVTIYGLPLGSYKVVEVAKLGHTDSYTGQTLTFSEKELIKQVLITNRLNSTRLTVRKTIPNLVEDEQAGFTPNEFTFVVKDPTDNQYLTFENNAYTGKVADQSAATQIKIGLNQTTVLSGLPYLAGDTAFVLEEIFEAGEAVYTLSFSSSKNPDAQMEGDVYEWQVEQTLENNLREGALNVRKTTSGLLDGNEKFYLAVEGLFLNSEGDAATGIKRFTFAADPAAGEHAVNTDVEVSGTVAGQMYTVYELPSANASLSDAFAEGEINGNFEVSYSDGQTARSELEAGGTLTVTNTRTTRTGDDALTIRKTVVGNLYDGIANANGEFQAALKLSDGRYLRFTGADGDYTYDGLSNTAVTITIKAGQTAKLNDIPTGLGITVEEVPANNSYIASYTVDGRAVNEFNSSDAKAIEITNTVVNQLSIVKKVGTANSATAEHTFHFNILRGGNTVAVKAVAGGYEVAADGTITDIPVATTATSETGYVGAGSVKIWGLENGVQYTVTELSYAGYTLQSLTGNTVTFQENGVSGHTATAINNRNGGGGDRDRDRDRDGGTDTPDTQRTSGSTDIPDANVPLADSPFTILDDNIPLAKLPQTGGRKSGGLLGLLMGLGAMLIKKRKTGV